MQPDITKIRDEGLTKDSSGLNVHDHLKALTIEELKDISRADRLPWHTLCLNVTGDLNVGTIIRTSHCLGATSVIVFGRQKIDNRSLVGAANYIKVEKVQGIDQLLELQPVVFKDLLEARKLTPVFVESGGFPVQDVDWKLRLQEMQRRGTNPCLIMGNETGGIPSDIHALDKLFPNSFTVSIPQKGVIRSLNVGIAHGIVSYDLCMKMEWM